MSENKEKTMRFTQSDKRELLAFLLPIIFAMITSFEIIGFSQSASIFQFFVDIVHFILVFMPSAFVFFSIYQMLEDIFEIARDTKDTKLLVKKILEKMEKLEVEKKPETK